MTPEWICPNWDEGGRVHNWRDYATPELREIWPELSRAHRQVIYNMLVEWAGKEDWD